MTKTKLIKALKRVIVSLLILWIATFSGWIYTIYSHKSIEEKLTRKIICEIKKQDLKMNQKECEELVSCLQQGKSPLHCFPPL